MRSKRSAVAVLAQALSLLVLMTGAFLTMYTKKIGEMPSWQTRVEKTTLLTTPLKTTKNETDRKNNEPSPTFLQEISQMKAIQRVFVVGSSHSGTSILERTIGNMHGAMCIGIETGLFVENQQSIKIKQELREWDQLAQAGNFTHWVEKTPAHICHANRILKESPDAKIVWIHRDPLRVAKSLLRRGNFENMQYALDFWVETNKCILDLLPHHNILPVAHADFTSEDRVLTVLANISAFLGLPQPEDRLALSLLPPANATRCHPVTCRRYPNDAAKRRDLHAALVRTLAAQALAEDEAHWQLLLDHGLRRPRPIFHDRLRSWQLCRPWYPVRDRFYHRVPSPARLRLAGEIGPAALGVVNSFWTPGCHFKLTQRSSATSNCTNR